MSILEVGGNLRTTLSSSWVAPFLETSSCYGHWSSDLIFAKILGVQNVIDT